MYVVPPSRDPPTTGVLVSRLSRVLAERGLRDRTQIRQGRVEIVSSPVTPLLSVATHQSLQIGFWVIMVDVEVSHFQLTPPLVPKFKQGTEVLLGTTGLSRDHTSDQDWNLKNNSVLVLELQRGQDKYSFPQIPTDHTPRGPRLTPSGIPHYDRTITFTGPAKGPVTSSGPYTSGSNPKLVLSKNYC